MADIVISLTGKTIATVAWVKWGLFHPLSPVCVAIISRNLSWTCLECADSLAIKVVNTADVSKTDHK